MSDDPKYHGEPLERPSYLPYETPAWIGEDVSMFDRITADPAILGGKPCIKGTRISVDFLLELIAHGASREDILKAYPHLSAEDVEQAVLYAARFLKNEVVITTEIRH
jgi:uncharacterized protein (DUF433 family)